MAKTAELENLEKKWEGVEEQFRQRNKTRQKRRVSSSREGQLLSITTQMT